MLQEIVGSWSTTKKQSPMQTSIQHHSCKLKNYNCEEKILSNSTKFKKNQQGKNIKDLTNIYMYQKLTVFDRTKLCMNNQ